MKELLKTFPVVTKIPVIWGDMDSFQHVNNVIYFRYFEKQMLPLYMLTYVNKFFKNRKSIFSFLPRNSFSLEQIVLKLLFVHFGQR